MTDTVKLNNLEKIPKANIADGKAKYIQIKLYDKEICITKHVVQSTKGCAYHNDVQEYFKNEYSNLLVCIQYNVFIASYLSIYIYIYI